MEGYTEYYSIGSDVWGQLGHAQNKQADPKDRYVSNPKSLSFDILIDQVTCGASHTIILSQRQEVFSFGSNSHGQLGLNDRHLPFSTAPLLLLPVKRMTGTIKKIVAGGRHNLMLIEKDN